MEERPTEEAAVWNDNTQLIIPPIAITRGQNGSTVHCSGFNLPGPVISETRSTINIIKNLSTVEENGAQITNTSI